MSWVEQALDLGAGAARTLLTAASEKGRLRSALRKSVEQFRANGAQGVLDALRERAGSDRGYDEWIARFDSPSPGELARLAVRAGSQAPFPLVSVVLTGEGTSEARQRSIRSLEAQLHARWELCETPAAAKGEIVMPLESGDVLSPLALFAVASALRQDAGADAAFADFDTLDDRDRRCDPVFKPGWDPELSAWPEYVGRATAFRSRIAEGVASAAELPRRVERAVRVPHVLCHSPPRPGSEIAAETAGPIRTSRVTAIVPTRDGGDLLRRCVDSLRSPTAYADLELIVVDNQSSARPTRELLLDLERTGGARVLPYDRPFNYAAINNMAARAATGEVLLLLNDDVEATSAGWLSEMVRLATRPGVGPVGAKLLYPDGTIQHGGVVTGLFGMVGHLHRGARAERPAWMGEYPRTVSAVTGAVLAIRRETWMELGGLDEELAVAFNDVDLCLRAEKAGYRTVYTPRARLLHHESQSRGRDDTPGKRARFERETAYLRARWGSRLDDDPHYSPNLSRFSERPTLAWPPRVPRLWE